MLPRRINNFSHYVEIVFLLFTISFLRKIKVVKSRHSKSKCYEE